LDCSRSDSGALACLVLAPDLELGLIAINAGDPSAATVRVTRLVDSAVADLEGFQRPLIAEPIGHELAEERSLQETVKDDPWQRDALRVSLVVMDLVEITLRACVLHELARRRVLHELRQLLAGLDSHLLIAVPRRRATSSPLWFT
jgi:hypothetical protein